MDGAWGGGGGAMAAGGICLGSGGGGGGGNPRRREGGKGVKAGGKGERQRRQQPKGEKCFCGGGRSRARGGEKKEIVQLPWPARISNIRRFNLFLPSGRWIVFVKDPGVGARLDEFGAGLGPG